MCLHPLLCSLSALNGGVGLTLGGRNPIQIPGWQESGDLNPQHSLPGSALAGSWSVEGEWGDTPGSSGWDARVLSVRLSAFPSLIKMPTGTSCIGDVPDSVLASAQQLTRKMAGYVLLYVPGVQLCLCLYIVSTSYPSYFLVATKIGICLFDYAVLVARHIPLHHSIPSSFSINLLT